MQPKRVLSEVHFKNGSKQEIYLKAMGGPEDSLPGAMEMAVKTIAERE